MMETQSKIAYAVWGAMDTLLQANAELQKNTRDAETDWRYLRDYCTVKVDVGQRTGKSSWIMARAQSDWLIVTDKVADYAEMGLSAIRHDAERLHEIVRRQRMVVIDQGYWLAPRNDPYFHLLMQAMYVPRTQQTLLILG